MLTRKGQKSLQPCRLGRTHDRREGTLAVLSGTSCLQPGLQGGGSLQGGLDTVTVTKAATDSHTPLP